MQINEVCKECKLTKKAVEYYEEKQLVQSQILENGYRDFSEHEVGQLRKIAILRRLDLSVAEIRSVLEDNKSALCDVLNQKALNHEMMKTKLQLIQGLAQNQDWKYTKIQLEAMEQKQTILERLLNVFPGYYGQYVCLHFAQYLKEPIANEEQQNAFETIVSFLDNIDFIIPLELQEYLDEISKNFDADFVEHELEGMNQLTKDPEKYITEHQEMLVQYLYYKQTDEYKQSSVYKLMKVLEDFHQRSGYYDIFIPAMKQLSRTYNVYHQGMEKANEVFMEFMKQSYRKKAEELFDGWNEAMIWSCLQEHMGQLLVNYMENPTAAVADVGDFCFFAGEPDQTLFEQLNGNKLLVPQNEKWEKQIEDYYGSRVKKIIRYAIKKEHEIFDAEMLTHFVNGLDREYTVKLFDEQLFLMARSEEWSADLCSQYADYEDYKQKNALGVAILKRNELVSGASAYVAYREGIEIEIDTKPEYRQKGLATVCGAQLILECLDRRLYPSWDAHDLRSVALAEKLGYHLDFPYTAYELVF